MEVGWLPWNYFEPESLFLKMFGAIRWWLLESNKINPLEGTCKNCSLVRRQRAVSHRHVSKRRVFHKLITQQRRILKIKEGTEFSRIMWWENRKHCNYTSVLHISKTIEMERMLQVFLLELLISQIFEQQKKKCFCCCYHQHQMSSLWEIWSQILYSRGKLRMPAKEWKQILIWIHFLPNIEHSVMLPLSFDCSLCQLSNKLIERTEDI